MGDEARIMLSDDIQLLGAQYQHYKSPDGSGSSPTYPLLAPNAARMIQYAQSEFIHGCVIRSLPPEKLVLHSRNSGMKIVRANEAMTNLR